MLSENKTIVIEIPVIDDNDLELSMIFSLAKVINHYENNLDVYKVSEGEFNLITGRIVNWLCSKYTF